VSVSVSDLVVSVASHDDAAEMVEVIHAAFGARPPLDPPSTAGAETPESLVATLRRGTGVVARVDGRVAGVVLVLAEDGVASLQRVSVHPDFQRHGIASAMVAAAEQAAADRGCSRVELFARGELAELVAFWIRRGYVVDRPAPHGVVLTRPVPVVLSIPTAEDMQALGERLAALLRAGDLVIATGDLGAGKTTLTQGIGRGLASAGPVTSPTFVLSRVHPSRAGRPTLVHVDAYRLRSATELDDLDLDATLPTAVTMVEWGAGLAEDLAPDRLDVALTVPAGRPDGDETRLVTLTATGPRWRDVDLAALGGPRG